MIRLGLLPLISGALQLCVPSYALRLLRRFGAQRVGWFLVIAFSALALAHLIDPLKPLSAGPAPGLTLDPMYAIASVLLLIGMSHIESLFSERVQVQQQEKRLLSDWQLQIEEKSASCEELLQEIASLRKEKESLGESEALYRFLFVENPQAMWILDLRSLRFLTVNNAALRLYGFAPEEWSALTASELVAPESAAAFRQDLAKPCSGPQFRGRWRHRRRDRKLIDVDITAVDLKYSGSPARLILATDASQQHQLESEAAQAQKMQIVAHLADRFGHHFNNILTVIDGHVNLLLHKSLGASTAEQIKQISFAVNRATGLTRQLVAAGGRQFAQMQVLQLNAVLRELNPMLNRLVGESITFKDSHPAHLPAIMADAGVLEHIIVNLVLNARNAMPSGGALTIKTAVVCRDNHQSVSENFGRAESAREETASSPRPSPPKEERERISQTRSQARGAHAGRAAEFVCLSVGDTGCGIPAEVQAHLFEPFCTATENGKGTGLGLASVYGAVKQHGGWIEFSTDVGVGTEFRLFFPIAPAAVVAAQKQSIAAAPIARETILLVEGEERARGLAGCVLSRYGYRVIEADSAATALLLFEGQAEKIALLLIDLRLPDGIPGVALTKHLRKTRPDLKVLYTSDCEPTPEGHEPALVEGLEFVPKPYSPAKLLQAVQGCLSRVP